MMGKFQQFLLPLTLFLFLGYPAGAQSSANRIITDSQRVKKIQGSPSHLPGSGLSEFDFLYAGEGKVQNMFIVQKGKITWSYQNAGGRGEISDAILLTNGHILFAHQFGVTEIDREKNIIWNYDAPAGFEIHTVQPIGRNKVLFIQNGNPAKVIIMDKQTNTMVRELVLPVANPLSVHVQFRNARLTKRGTLLVAHMDLDRISEYDEAGQELLRINFPHPWSALELTNGNILACSNTGIVQELTRSGVMVWAFDHRDLPDYTLYAAQKAQRLASGNTIMNSWFNEWNGTIDTANAPVQVIEVTPDKKVVWALSEWVPPVNLGPSTTFQLLKDAVNPDDLHFGSIQ